MKKLHSLGINHPKAVIWTTTILTIIILALAVIPTLQPDLLPLPQIKVDTDPENMLSSDEPVRVFHNQKKKEFGLYDFIVVGVVNKTHKQGVFNKQSLTNIYELTEYAKSLDTVIDIDVMSPSTVDSIEQQALGVVKFEWLMAKPPASDEEALTILKKAQNIPFLNGTVVSEDGKAVAIYIPIKSKNISYEVAEDLKEKIAEFKNSNDEFHITGLPIAQDTFGVEMFKQMAISAPIAMGLVFALMWFFFRKVKLIISPMLVAIISVIITMGLLIISGNTIHIMSSMIPIFIMPIAVLDAIHIISDFFDHYQKTHDKKQTIERVMDELGSPMLYTSLTTAAGFGSLAFTPIPPVQVFGIFIAIGVFIAWLFTITFIPAYIMLMKDSNFEGFGLEHKDDKSLLHNILAGVASVTYKHAKLIMLVVVGLSFVACYGITKIEINDNPVKWFSESHPIRIADKELNARFAGTYIAYLTLELADKEFDIEENFAGYSKEMDEAIRSTNMLGVLPKEEFFNALRDYVDEQEYSDKWEDVYAKIDEVEQANSLTFKNPEMLEFVGNLQEDLLKTGLVGKSNSLSDIVKTVHREMFGDTEKFTIPASQAGVAQTLISYQNSHRPDDLWKMVTPDYKKLNIWIQLKSGDNKDMNAVVSAVDEFFKNNKPPLVLKKHKWFGLTYINTIWQDKMVAGMAKAFLGSFVIVLILMVILFRSLWWGMLSMIPLTVTIGMIYGVIGLVGKDYDMPVAVLSSLSLGLAVDYAIHFLARSREIYKKHGNWGDAVKAVFDEPAVAITRNVIVVGVGFMPLLLAPLVPYQTVGVFISAILLVAGVATLVILPSMVRLLERFLFRGSK